MKNSLLLAATALLGCASGKVHKLKLQKVPLSERLVSEVDISCYTYFVLLRRVFAFLILMVACFNVGKC